MAASVMMMVKITVKMEAKIIFMGAVSPAGGEFRAIAVKRIANESTGCQRRGDRYRVIVIACPE
jgi:hypothetical protein